MTWVHRINGTVVTPKNTRQSEIEEYKEIGKRRVKYPASVVLMDDDYIFAKEVEKSKKKSTYEISKNDIVKVRAEFVRNDMQFDDNKKVCTISTNPFDDYTLINEMEDKEANILECSKYAVKAELKSYLVFFTPIVYGTWVLGNGNHYWVYWHLGDVPDYFSLYASNVPTGLEYTVTDYQTNREYLSYRDIYVQERIIVDKDRELSTSEWILLDDSSDEYSVYARIERIYINEVATYRGVIHESYAVPTIVDVKAGNIVLNISLGETASVPTQYLTKEWAAIDIISEDILEAPIDAYQNGGWHDESYNIYEPGLTPVTFSGVTLRNTCFIKKSIYNQGNYCGLYSTYNNAVKLETAINHLFKSRFVTPDKSDSSRTNEIDDSRSNTEIHQQWAAIITQSHTWPALSSAAVQWSSGAIRSTFLFNHPSCPGEPDFYKDYGYHRRSYSSDVPQGTYYLIHLSDFKRPTASNPATKGMLTFKSIMDYLTIKKNCSWHIDLANKIRIEHLKYYETLQPGLKLIGTTQTYSYVKDETPARQIFEEGESHMEDFTKKEIVYENVPVLNGEKENKQEYSMSGFYTDIDGLNQRLDSIPSDGWVLVEVDDEMNVARDKGVHSGEKIQNGNLSTVNCLRLDYRHQCYREDLYIDNVKLTAYSVRKQKKQTLLPFEEDSDINILNSLETDLGVGEFVSLKYPPVDGGTYKAEVLYD